MSWRELVQTVASFRGVSFYVDTAERSGGRRGVTHEYPFRDVPFREDLGRQAVGFTVEGHVSGDNYLASRDALITALEAFGPGELVHPYYGTRQVAVTGFKVRESAGEGGLARFSIELEETPSKPLQPTATVDTATQFQARAITARAAVSTEFLSTYAPGVHTASLAGQVVAAAGAVSAALAAAGQSAQDAAASAARSVSLAANAATLVLVGADVLGGLVELLAAANAGGAAGLVPVYNTPLGTRPEPVTSNREMEGLNFDALQQLLQRLVVVRAAELALTDVFTTLEEATSLRGTLAGLLDEQLELAGDDAYPALAELRAALVQAVPSQDANLPHLLPVTPPETVPSLVLTWGLYGSVELESDVLARNRVVNPLFLVGGTPLQVLSGA